MFILATEQKHIRMLWDDLMKGRWFEYFISCCSLSYSAVFVYLKYMTNLLVLCTDILLYPPTGLYYHCPPVRTVWWLMISWISCLFPAILPTLSRFRQRRRLVGTSVGSSYSFCVVWWKGKGLLAWFQIKRRRKYLNIQDPEFIIQRLIQVASIIDIYSLNCKNMTLCIVLILYRTSTVNRYWNPLGTCADYSSWW